MNIQNINLHLYPPVLIKIIQDYLTCQGCNKNYKNLAICANSHCNKLVCDSCDGSHIANHWLRGNFEYTRCKWCDNQIFVRGPQCIGKPTWTIDCKGSDTFQHLYEIVGEKVGLSSILFKLAFQSGEIINPYDMNEITARGIRQEDTIHIWFLICKAFGAPETYRGLYYKPGNRSREDFENEAKMIAEAQYKDENQKLLFSLDPCLSSQILYEREERKRLGVML